MALPMTRPTDRARRLDRRLTPMLGLLLLAVLFVAGSHHHDDGSGPHICAVCTAGHPHAVADGSAAGPGARDVRAGAVAPAGERAPREQRLEPAHSRSPPLA
jgi:hypothetical protein